MTDYLKLYTAVIFLSVIALIILLLSVSHNSVLHKKNRFLSLLFLCDIMVCALCEWGGVMLEEYRIGGIWLHIAVKCIELSCAPFIGFLPILVLRDKKTGILDWITFGLLSLNVLLEFISAFTGFIYKVDSENHYSHSTCYVIYLISYIIGTIYFLYMFIRICGTQNRNYRLPTIAVVVAIFASVILQLIYDSIKVDWIAISVGAILLFKFYGDMSAMTDGLTGLLNRLAFDQSVRNINYDAILVYIDVNKFKKINDEYGHMFGDECLKQIAKCLKKAYFKYGRVYRYGGDEFCVIIKKSIKNIESINDTFLALIDESKKINDKYPGVALGYSTYRADKDEILDILQEADDKMYENKHR
jgi:diguanylate cyclase (GGDEF)-like protein